MKNVFKMLDELAEDGYVKKSTVRGKTYYTRTELKYDGKNFKKKPAKPIKIYKWELLDAFRLYRSYTVDDVMSLKSDFRAAGRQMINSLLRELVWDGSITEEMRRGEIYYSLKDDEDDEEYDYSGNSSSFEIPLDFHVTINGKDYRL